MKHSLDYNCDDESFDQDNDNTHEESETTTCGARFVKQKHGRTVDQITASAMPVDADSLANLAVVPEQDHVEVRRGKKAEDDDGAELELPRAVADAKARRQAKEKLAAAQAKFGKLPKSAKEPAHGN